MERELRASLIAGGAAAVLSAIVGLVAKVGFLPVVLRALVGGLVFGGLVFGAFAVIRRFLPELFSSTGAPVEEGGNVNIVLPAEGPDGEPMEAAPGAAIAALPQRAWSGRAESPGTAGVGAEPEREDYVLGQESLLDDGGEDGEEGAGAGEAVMAGEVLEDLPAAGGPPQPEAAVPRGESPRPVQESRGAAQGTGGAHRAREARPSVGLEDLDVLPDLDSLSDGFERETPGTGNPVVRGYDDESPAAQSGGGRDPAMLAQAVRTLLKRDQER